ncbi:zf-CCHC domain-containing protein [Tanacetum coccineum]
MSYQAMWDTAYWGLLGVKTTFDIFRNILLLYCEYDVLVFSGYGVLILFPSWSLLSVGTNTPYLLAGYGVLRSRVGVDTAYPMAWIRRIRVSVCLLQSRMSNTSDKGTMFGDGTARVGMQLRSSPKLLSELTNEDRMETLEALGSICNSIKVDRNNADVIPCKVSYVDDSINLNVDESTIPSDPIVQSVDINKSTSYAGVAGGSAKDQPNINSNFRTLVADPVFDGVNISIPHKVVEKVSTRFEHTLYGYFIGKRMAFPVVEYYARNNWAKHGLKRIMMNSKGFFFFKFDSRAGLEAVSGGMWSPFFKEDGISLIATFIGKPVMLDSYTSSCVMIRGGRSSFARCLIKVNQNGGSVGRTIQLFGPAFEFQSLNRSMDSDKYLEGQSMQRPPLFESDHFIYWKNRFETYVKAKDLDLWHIILNGDFPPLAKNEVTQILEVVPFEEQSDDLKKKLAKNNEAKMVLYNALPKKEYERIFMCKTAKDIWQSLLITHQGNSQVKDNKIDLLVQQYEQFTILEEESIDSGFARFNTIITSLKALDEGFSSKNYFLRALHPKWRTKVTAIEELKDLSSLALDELIGKLKVHEVLLEIDSEIYKGKKERIMSISLKAKKESSDDETSTSESDDEEYVMVVRNFKKFFKRKGKFVRQPREEKKSFRQKYEKKGKSDRKCFRCGDQIHLIGDCPKLSRNRDQKAFIGGS